MANRNVSQLPENTDPQDTDWILGASGNSPSVLQKIALGNLPSSSPGTSGGSIKFSLPVNENKVLESSGYYFTDNTVSDITIDCSNLGIGDHIIWHNLSTQAVFFSGLNSIDGVSIPTNKGVKIAANDSIKFFLKDSNKNIKKLSGSYTIDWIPGMEPNTLNFNFVSGGDTNGIVYWLGATKYNATFVNPVSRGEITVNASSVNGGYTPNKVFNRTIDNGGFTSWWSTNSANNDEAGWLEFNFNNHPCRVNRVTIATTWIHDMSFVSPVIIEAWNGNSWIQLFSGTSSLGPLTYYDTGIFPNPDFYSKYRYKSGITGRQVVFDELECYGELML